MKLIKGNTSGLGTLLGILIGVISLLILSPSSQGDQEGRKVGIKLGLVNVEGEIGTAVVLGGMADLGSIAPKWKLEGSLEFWHKGCNYSPELDYSYTEIGLDATVKRHFPLTGSQIKPYCGGGLGMHILRRNFDWHGYLPPSPHLHNYSSNELVIHLIGGAEYPVASHLLGFAECKYSTGGWDYFGLLLGLKFDIQPK